MYDNLRPHFSFPYSLRTRIILQEKKTALHWSSINGHKDVCSLLVEAHAEVNALDNVRPVLFLSFLYFFFSITVFHVRWAFLFIF